jgi:hypothetical protein
VDSPATEAVDVLLSPLPGTSVLGDGYYDLTLKGRSNVGLASVASFYVAVAVAPVEVDNVGGPVLLRLSAPGSPLLSPSYDVPADELGFDPAGYEVFYFQSSHFATGLPLDVAWSGRQELAPTFATTLWSLDPAEPAGTVAGHFPRFSRFLLCLVHIDTTGTLAGKECLEVTGDTDQSPAGMLDEAASLGVASLQAQSAGAPGRYYFTVTACTFSGVCSDSESARSPWIVVSPDVVPNVFPRATMTSRGVVGTQQYTAPGYLAMDWWYEPVDLVHAPIADQRLVFTGGPLPVDCTSVPDPTPSARSLVITQTSGGQTCILDGLGQTVTVQLCTTTAALPPTEVCYTPTVTVQVTDEGPIPHHFSIAGARENDAGELRVQPSGGQVTVSFDGFSAAVSGGVTRYEVAAVTSCTAPFSLLAPTVTIAASAALPTLARSACKACTVCDSRATPASPVRTGGLDAVGTVDARRLCACCLAVQAGCPCAAHPNSFTTFDCIGDASRLCVYDTTPTDEIEGSYQDWFVDTFPLTRILDQAALDASLPLVGPTRPSRSLLQYEASMPVPVAGRMHLTIRGFGVTDAVQEFICTPALVIDDVAPGPTNLFANGLGFAFASGVEDGFVLASHVVSLEWAVGDASSGIVSVELTVVAMDEGGTPHSFVHSGTPESRSISDLRVPTFAVGDVIFTLHVVDAGDATYTEQLVATVDATPPLVVSPAVEVLVVPQSDRCTVVDVDSQLRAVTGLDCPRDAALRLDVSLDGFIVDDESGIAYVDARLVGETGHLRYAAATRDGLGVSGDGVEVSPTGWRRTTTTVDAAGVYSLTLPTMDSMYSGFRMLVQLHVVNRAGLSSFAEAVTEVMLDVDAPACATGEPSVVLVGGLPTVRATTCADPGTGIASLACALVDAVDTSAVIAAADTVTLVGAARYAVPILAGGSLPSADPFGPAGGAGDVLAGRSVRARCTVCDGADQCDDLVSGEAVTLGEAESGGASGGTGVPDTRILLHRVTRGGSAEDDDEAEMSVASLGLDTPFTVSSTFGPTAVVRIAFVAPESMPPSPTDDAAWRYAPVGRTWLVRRDTVLRDALRVCAVLRNAVVACTDTMPVIADPAARQTTVPAVEFASVAGDVTGTLARLTATLSTEPPCPRCQFDVALVRSADPTVPLLRFALFDGQLDEFLLDATIERGTDYKLVSQAFDPDTGFLAVVGSSTLAAWTDADAGDPPLFGLSLVPRPALWLVPADGRVRISTSRDSSLPADEVLQVGVVDVDGGLEVQDFQDTVWDGEVVVQVSADVVAERIRICVRSSVHSLTVCSVPMVTRHAVETFVAQLPDEPCVRKDLVLVCSLPDGSLGSLARYAGAGTVDSLFPAIPLHGVLSYPTTVSVQIEPPLGDTTTFDVLLDLPPLSTELAAVAAPLPMSDALIGIETLNGGRGVRISWDDSSLAATDDATAVALCAPSVGCASVDSSAGSASFPTACPSSGPLSVRILRCLETGVCTDSSDAFVDCTTQQALESIGDEVDTERASPVRPSLFVPPSVAIDRTSGTATVHLLHVPHALPGDELVFVSVGEAEVELRGAVDGSSVVSLVVPAAVDDGSLWQARLVRTGSTIVAESAEYTMFDGSPPTTGSVRLSPVHETLLNDVGGSSLSLVVTVALESVTDAQSGVAHSRVCLLSCSSDVPVECSVLPGSSAYVTMRRTTADSLYPCFVVGVEVSNGAGLVTTIQSSQVRLDVPELDSTTLDSLLDVHLWSSLTEVSSLPAAPLGSTTATSDGSSLVVEVHRPSLTVCPWTDAVMTVLLVDGAGTIVSLAANEPFPLPGERLFFVGQDLPFFPPDDAVQARVRISRPGNVPVTLVSPQTLTIVQAPYLHTPEDVYTFVLDESTDWDLVEAEGSLSVAYSSGTDCLSLVWPEASRPLLRGGIQRLDSTTVSIAVSVAGSDERALFRTVETHGDGPYLYAVPNTNGACASLTSADAITREVLAMDVTVATCSHREGSPCAAAFYIFANVERRYRDGAIRHFSLRYLCRVVTRGALATCRFAGVVVPDTLREVAQPGHLCERRFLASSMVADMADCTAVGPLIASRARLDVDPSPSTSSVVKGETGFSSLDPAIRAGEMGIFLTVDGGVMASSATVSGIRVSVWDRDDVLVQEEAQFRSARTPDSHWSALASFGRTLVLMDSHSTIAIARRAMGSVASVGHVFNDPQYLNFGSSQAASDFFSGVFFDTYNSPPSRPYISPAVPFRLAVSKFVTVMSTPTGQDVSSSSVSNACVTAFIRDPYSRQADVHHPLFAVDVDHPTLTGENYYGERIHVDIMGHLYVVSAPGNSPGPTERWYLYSVYLPGASSPWRGDLGTSHVTRSFNDSSMVGFGRRGIEASANARVVLASSSAVDEARVYLFHAVDDSSPSLETTQTFTSATDAGFGKDIAVSPEGLVLAISSNVGVELFTRGLGQCTYARVPEGATTDVHLTSGTDAPSGRIALAPFGEQLVVSVDDTAPGDQSGHLIRTVTNVDRYSLLYPVGGRPRPRARHLIEAKVVAVSSNLNTLYGPGSSVGFNFAHPNWAVDEYFSNGLFQADAYDTSGALSCIRFADPPAHPLTLAPCGYVPLVNMGVCIGSSRYNFAGCGLANPWDRPPTFNVVGSTRAYFGFHGFSVPVPGGSLFESGIPQPIGSEFYTHFGRSVAHAHGANIVVFGAPKMVTGGRQHGSIFAYVNRGTSSEVRYQLTADLALLGADTNMFYTADDLGPAFPSSGTTLDPSLIDLTDTTGYGGADRSLHIGRSVAVSADGSVIAAGGNNVVAIFERQSNGLYENVAMLSYPPSIYTMYYGDSVALSPDGQRLFVGHRNRRCFAVNSDGCGDVYVYSAPYTSIPWFAEPHATLRQSFGTPEADRTPQFNADAKEFFGTRIQHSTVPDSDVVLVGGATTLAIMRPDSCTESYVVEFELYDIGEDEPGLNAVTNPGGFLSCINSDGSLLAVAWPKGGSYVIDVYAFPWHRALRIDVGQEVHSMNFYVDDDRLVVKAGEIYLYELTEEAQTARGVAAQEAVPMYECPVDNSLLYGIGERRTNEFSACPVVDVGTPLTPVLSGSWTAEQTAVELVVDNVMAAGQSLHASYRVVLPASDGTLAYRYCEFRVDLTSWHVVPCAHTVAGETDLSLEGLRLDRDVTVVLQVRGCRRLHDCDEAVEVEVVPAAEAPSDVAPAVTLSRDSIEFSPSGPAEVRLRFTDDWTTVAGSPLVGGWMFDATAHGERLVAQVRASPAAAIGFSAPLVVDYSPPTRGEVHVDLETATIYLSGFGDAQSGLGGEATWCLVALEPDDATPVAGSAGALELIVGSPVPPTDTAPTTMTGSRYVDMSSPLHASRVSTISVFGESDVTPVLVLVADGGATIVATGTRRTLTPSAPSFSGPFDDSGPVSVAPGTTYFGLLFHTGSPVMYARTFPHYQSSMPGVQVAATVDSGVDTTLTCVVGTDSTISLGTHGQLTVPSGAPADQVLVVRTTVANTMGLAVEAFSHSFHAGSIGSGSAVDSSLTTSRTPFLSPLDAVSELLSARNESSTPPFGGEGSSSGTVQRILRELRESTNVPPLTVDVAASNGQVSVAVDGAGSSAEPVRYTHCIGTVPGGCQLAGPTVDSAFDVVALTSSYQGLQPIPVWCGTAHAFDTDGQLVGKGSSCVCFDGSTNGCPLPTDPR